MSFHKRVCNLIVTRFIFHTSLSSARNHFFHSQCYEQITQLSRILHIQNFIKFNKMADNNNNNNKGKALLVTDYNNVLYMLKTKKLIMIKWDFLSNLLSQDAPELKHIPSSQGSSL